MPLHIFNDKEALADNLATWMCDLINTTLKEQEFFSLVLSGGETPRMLYKKLASAPFKDDINWNKLRIFWGDERMVPFSDDRNNAKMASDTLLNHVDIPQEQVFIINTEIEPKFSADKYRDVLHTFFDNTEKSFDLVLLGMGNDGHTLSLFPGSPLLEDNKHWVKAAYYDQQDMYRITLMPQIVNRAAHIAFMLQGAEKADTLHRVLEGPYEPHMLPAQLIKPTRGGTVHWFMDKEAAAKIQGSHN